MVMMALLVPRFDCGPGRFSGCSGGGGGGSTRSGCGCAGTGGRHKSARHRIEWIELVRRLLHIVDGLQVGLHEFAADFLRASLVLLERFAAALEEAHVLGTIFGGPKPEVPSTLFFEELASAAVGADLSFFLQIVKVREEVVKNRDSININHYYWWDELSH